MRVTPAKRGRGRKRRQPTGENWLDKTPAERHQSMTWMQRLKRVFNIDIETCERCAGHVKIIACIEDPAVIERILAHLKGKAGTCQPVLDTQPEDNVFFLAPAAGRVGKLTSVTTSPP